MAVVFVADCAANAPALTSPAVASMNCAGANFLIAIVSYFGSAATAPTDSSGNTWSAGPTLNESGTGAAAIFYVENATCTNGQSFTSTNLFADGIAVEAFSGVKTSSSKDQSSILNGDDSTGTIGTTSITPTQANELVVSGLIQSNGMNTLTIDGGFTVTTYQPSVPGQSVSCALAYLIQTTAAAAAPNWTFTNPPGVSSIGTTMTSFFVGSAPPPASRGNHLPYMGVG